MAISPARVHASSTTLLILGKSIGRRYAHSNASRSCTHRFTQVKEAQNKAVAASEGSVQGWVKLHFNSPGA